MIMNASATQYRVTVPRQWQWPYDKIPRCRFDDDEEGKEEEEVCCVYVMRD